MRNSKTIIIIFTFLIILVCSSLVSAISIGLSPGRITYDNMLKGGYAQREVTISTNSNADIFGTFSKSGEISAWMRFEPANTSFKFSSANPFKLTIIIEPPEDTRSDLYSGRVRFITDKFGDISGRAGGFVKAGVELNVGVNVLDEQIIKCRSGAFDFDDIEIGFPLKIYATIFNDGNVRIVPKVSFDIWDKNQDTLVLSDEFAGKEILPTTSEVVIGTISNELEEGQYWSRVSVQDCGVSSLMTFSVVEQGGILDKGVLKTISNALRVFVGEPVEIKAVFENQGSRSVRAQFKGNIKLDNKIVQLLETDQIDVPSGETTDLISYFTPDVQGRYVISGRVTYNNKITFEKSSILNVNNFPAQEKKVNIIPLIIYIVLIVTIIYMIRKIIKTRKRKF